MHKIGQIVKIIDGDYRGCYGVILESWSNGNYKIVLIGLTLPTPKPAIWIINHSEIVAIQHVKVSE